MGPYVQIIRAVGPAGTVQMKVGPLDEPRDGLTPEQEEGIRSGYEDWFDEEATQVGAACLPWSDSEDGSDGDD